jgi:hypothetical protein
MTARLLTVASLLLLAACASPSRPPPSPQTRADQAAMSACRSQADQTYAAQNRGDLIRDQNSYAPFATNYDSGVSSGLGARYQRDTMVEDCLRGIDAAKAQAAQPAAKPATVP